MPKVGEAWYELTARDEKLVAGLRNAESKLTSSGQVGEKSFGGVSTAIDKTGEAANRASAPVGRVSGFFGRFADRSAEAGLTRTTRGFNLLERGAGAVEDRIPRVTGAIEKLGSGLGRAAGGLGKFGGGLAQLIPGLGMLGGAGGPVALIAAAGVGIGVLAGKGIAAARDLNETMTKSQVVFGKSASVVEQFGSTAASSMGISKNAAIGAAATFGNLFVALKLPTDVIPTMSTGLVKLAGDLASFNNVSPEEALAALQSGLVGEIEPLRKFGVNLNEATIAQKAFDLGLISSVKGAVTPAVKAQAAYALILDQTKTAQGDFARTSTGLANQQRISAAKVEDAFARLGQVLLPIAGVVVPMLADAFTAVLGVLADVGQNLSEFYQANKGLFDLLGQLAGIILGAVVFAFQAFADVVGRAFGFIQQVVGGAFEVIKGVVSGIIGTIRNVMDVASQIPGPWQESAKQLRDTLQGMQNDVDSWGTGTAEHAGKAADDLMVNVAGGLTDGKATVEAAATDALTDPIVGAMADANVGVKKEAKKTPHEIAKGLLDGRFNVKEVLDQIKQDVAGSLSKHKEIAAIESFLASKAYRKGIADSRPEVAATWKAYGDDAKDRLFALKNNVPQIAAATGQSYADALAAKKKEVAGSAEALQKGASAALGASVKSGKAAGRDMGRAYADSIHDEGSYLHKQVEAYLRNAEAQMRFRSPPKEGPLKDTYKWGAQLGQAYADSVVKEQPYFSARIGEYLSAFSPQRIGIQPGIAGASGGSVSNSSSVGAIHVGVNVDRLVADDPQQIRELARSLGNEIRLSLVRQPVAFSMPPK